MTIAVAWYDRVRRIKIWCQAKRKTTTTYAESVATICGHYVIGPCGISENEPVTCEDCIARLEPSP